jgi:hypothetical protein
VVAEKPDEVEAPVRSPRSTPRRVQAPMSALIPDAPPPSAIPDHVAVEATMALPPTVDDEGEAAEQALSDDQAGQAPPVEHVTSPIEAATEDHAHTEATLSVPPTVDDEGEAAEQAMSADAAEASDKAAEEHATPPDHSGPGSTGGAA